MLEDDIATGCRLRSCLRALGRRAKVLVFAEINPFECGCEKFEAIAVLDLIILPLRSLQKSNKSSDSSVELLSFLIMFEFRLGA